MIKHINQQRLIPVIVLGVMYTLTRAELFKETDLDSLESILLIKVWLNFEGETSVFESTIVADPDEIQKMLPITTGQL